jgi:hypothetical protein
MISRQDYARFEPPADPEPYVEECEECDAPLRKGDVVYEVGCGFYCGDDCLIRGMTLNKITL